MPRSVERDLIPDLIAYRGYRQARWQAVILYGLAGGGKTAIARSLADNERIKSVFRDGIAWVDGSCDPEEEITRLCQALQLARAPGERWLQCWRRWVDAAERRFLLIIDDAVSAEGLPSLIAGLGPQAVALISTQQGAEIRAETERWVPANAIMEVGIHGLAPSEGRALVEAVIARPLTDADWDMVQEIGERVGWHPEALRLAAIEGREIGWPGMLDELKAGRMPWEEMRRLVNRQCARLNSGQQEWLLALVRGENRDAGFTIDRSAQVWQTETAIAERRTHILESSGLLTRESNTEAVLRRCQITPMARLALPEMMQHDEDRRNKEQ